MCCELLTSLHGCKYELAIGANINDEIRITYICNYCELSANLFTYLHGCKHQSRGGANFYGCKCELAIGATINNRIRITFATIAN